MKKWLSLLLVFALLPSMIPTTWAAETAEESPEVAALPEEIITEEYFEISLDGEPAMYYFMNNNLGQASFGQNYTPRLEAHNNNVKYHYSIKIDEICELVVAFTVFTGNIDGLTFWLQDASSAKVTPIQSTYDSSRADKNYYSYTRKYLLQPGTYYWYFGTGYTGHTHYCQALTFNQYQHEHDFSYYSWIQPATCEMGGYWGYKCKCGSVTRYPDGTMALGHTEVADAAVAATCTTPGKTAGSHCFTCGTVIIAQTMIPALEHTYTATNWIDNGDGTHTADYICRRDSSHTTTETADHEFSNGECACGAKEFVVVLGDLDGDGDADAFDLTILARHVGGIEELTDAALLANADVTNDGKINANDLTRHARYVGGIITSWDQE